MKRLSVLPSFKFSIQMEMRWARRDLRTGLGGDIPPASRVFCRPSYVASRRTWIVRPNRVAFVLDCNHRPAIVLVEFDSAFILSQLCFDLTCAHVGRDSPIAPRLAVHRLPKRFSRLGFLEQREIFVCGIRFSNGQTQRTVR